MRLALVQNNLVVDVIIANSKQGFQNYVVCPEWVGIGMDINTPEPIEEVQTVRVVSMRQARLALLQQGRLNQVKEAIAALTGPEGDYARIEWEYSTTVDIKSPLVDSIVSVLGFTPEEVQGLFNLAATL